MKDVSVENQGPLAEGKILTPTTDLSGGDQTVECPICNYMRCSDDEVIPCRCLSVQRESRPPLPYI